MKKHVFARLSRLGLLSRLLLVLFLVQAAEAHAQSISSVSIMNADTDQSIGTLSDQMTINLATMSSRRLNFRANTSPSVVGSVRFNYDGNSNYRIENVTPYAFAGNEGANYLPWTPTVGTHTLIVTPYSSTNGGGTVGTRRTYTFRVTDGGSATPAPTSTPAPQPTSTPLPSGIGVSFRPSQLGGIIANPDMGWQSTDRVNSSAMDANGFPQRIAYIKYYWKDLETSEGVYNWSRVDNHIAQARASGQKVAFRLVVSDNVESAPQWLRNQGVPGFVYSTPNDGGNANRWVPNFDNATARQKHFNFLAAFANRYNGHADLNSMDIGTVGLWGEWHFWATSPQVPMPSQSNLNLIIDRYVALFNRTPLVAQIEGKESFKYAVSKGTGWRGDCLGYVDNQMKYTYPGNISFANAQDAWKNGPVMFESCWTISQWISRGYSLRYVFDYALGYHVTAFTNKNATVPSSAVAEVERFLQKMGYRYVLRQISHERAVGVGGTMNLLLDMENVGVAPCYGKYNLAVQLRNSSGAVVWTGTTPTTVRPWMPGAFQVAQSVKLPTSVGRGTYKVAIALVDSTGKPKIRLASSGRDSAGWYPYTSVTVE